DIGQLYLSGLPEEGAVRVTWQGGQCEAPFTLSGTQKAAVSQATSVCR
ncbi:MAG: hypothetical protein EOO39_41950, partial [Cytophagaceae bacterium]